MSTPVDPTTGATGTSATGTATGGTGTPATGTTAGSADPSAAGTTPDGTTTAPIDYVIYEKSFTSDPNWPTDLVLSRIKGNWHEWDRRLHFIADQRGFGSYLRGTFPRPDKTLHPRAALSWENNNLALRGFILEHISEADYDIIKAYDDAHQVYEKLRTVHENQGLYSQIKTIKEALATRFVPGTPLSNTIDQIVKLHARFIKMGPIDEDKLLMILLFNALGEHYKPLQTSINDLFIKPGTTSADVRARLILEEQVIQDNAAPETTALAAVSSKPKTVCANCKRPTHRTEYCIASGGQMAGKTLEEARAAQNAARDAHKQGNTNKARGSRSTTPAPAQGNNATTPAKVTLNGQCYVLQTPTPPSLDPSSALSAISMPSYDEEEYLAVVASTDDSHVSLNWNSHTSPTIESVGFVCNSSHRSPLARIDELPFILDSGATCHISPEASDFKVLTSIPRHPVKGLNGSAVYAVGVGEIELRIAAGHVLKLTNVLYIPESSLRLISILTLNKSGNYTTHFDSTRCWVTNKSNTTLVRGSLSSSKRLYTLCTKTPYVQHRSTSTNSAFHASVPDLETWHRRLGHCNLRAIIEMAKNGVSKGMPIDLSTYPPKCDHCALGKQTHATVPKSREGQKATKRLERVYVDLCGPMAVTSRAGNLYSMNLIDDFSGYVWTLPLRSKADAFRTFQIWHKAVTVQSGELLKILVSDNGELVSKSMEDWCQLHGVNHQRTAPYTSAHNGRAECLHRTILGKARTMRIACNAPGFLWDKFCATAAYLTTLTAATANLGRTPYELWFGHKPSLSHLREIGCRAFALQLPPPSKIYARSKPYILIGYSPHSKAYRLWDPMSSKVITSFHVTFTKHLDDHPSSLLPGTTLGTDSAASPPSWDTHGPHTASSIPLPPTDPPPSKYPPTDPPPCTSAYLDPSSPFPCPIPVSDQNSDSTSRNTMTDNSSRNTVTDNTSTNTVNTSNNNADTSSNVDSSHTVDRSNNTVNASNTVITSNSSNNTAPANTNQRLTITIPPRPPPPPPPSLCTHRSAG